METALQSARRLTDEAKRERNAQKAHQAMEFYQTAMRLFPSSSGLVFSAEAGYGQRKTIFLEQGECLQLKEDLQRRGVQSDGQSHGGGGGATGGGTGVREEWVDAVQLGEKPNVHWDDVAGLEEAKMILQETVILPLKQPQFFRGKRKPYKGILLYGPSGTGKTYLAKAVATEAKAMFYIIQPSDVMSKWLGESEQFVKKFWGNARLNTPAIIFIDEVDSLCGHRSDSEHGATRRIKNELLAQMDGVRGNNEGILVLGATNLPQSIDEAFMRRFQKRIPINLPDKEARKRMFEIHIGDTPTSLRKPVDYNELADLTNGYSGDDIHTIVQTALLMPIHNATHFKQEGEVWLPCSSSESGAKKKAPIDIPDGKLGDPPVTLDHFKAAIKNTPHSVREESLKRIKMFEEAIGN